MANTGQRKIALWVDKALGVTPLNVKQFTEPGQLTAHTQYLKGVVEAEDSRGNHLILVQDLATLLSDAEQHSLQQALAQANT